MSALQPSSHVRRLNPEDAPAAIGVLCAGFWEDSFLRWAAPDELARTILGHRWATAAVGMAAEHVEGLIADDASGAALWAAPGTEFWTADGRAEFFDALTTALGDRVGELTRLAPISDAHPDEPHWYLHKIAVHPSRQGLGLGPRLVEPMLERADADGVPVYLESSNPRNRSFYHRLGFEPGLSIELQSGEDLLTMVRPAR